MLNRKTLLAATLMSGLFVMGSAMAETHTVDAVGMAFKPLVINIAPGDTVAWKKMSTHNVEMMEGLIPEGTEAFKSPMSENYEHTFEKEGIYVYQCTPHIGAGMGGAVIVGEPKNLDAVKNADVSGGLKRVRDKAVSAAEGM